MGERGEEAVGLAAERLVHERVEDLFLLHVVLLHEQVEGLGEAEKLVGVVGGRGRGEALEEVAHLGVLRAHHLGRARGHPGVALERREQGLFLDREVALHRRTVGRKVARRAQPVAFRRVLFRSGEPLVAGAVIAGHRLADAGHLSSGGILIASIFPAAWRAGFDAR
jgi:hypothetical protein